MLRRTFILLLALLLSAIIWWVGPLVSVGSWRPLSSVVVRLLLITALILRAVWPWIAQFTGGLFRHAQARRSAPEKSRARDRVSQRFYDAMSTLKSAGLAQQRSGWQQLRYRVFQRYLDDRPWFMILGPAGSGKTALLSESDRRFIFAGHYGMTSTVEPGPTRDCNWWLTEQAVWIDTAGDWVQLNGLSDETAKGLPQLFRLLRRFRKRPVLDGVFLCLNAHEILHASLNERKSLADALRVRLLEIPLLACSDQPVYLMLTHLDMLTGGETLLTLLSEDLLQKGLGFSVPPGNSGLQNWPVAEQGYQQMVSRVSQYTLERLHDISSVQQRQQLLFLIEALGALGRPLFSLLEQIFPASSRGYMARLQQVWLGSTRTLGEDNAAAGGSNPDAARPAGTLYNAAWQQAIARRYLPLRNHGNVPAGVRWRRMANYAAVLLLLAAAAGLLVSRYAWENDYLAWVAARFDESRRVASEVPVTNRAGDDLLVAYAQLDYMNVQLQARPTPTANPYFEHRLINEASRHSYQRHLRTFFWPAVEDYVAWSLAQDTAAKDDDVYGTLKVYLMLAEPQHREADALVSWFMARWDRFAPPQGGGMDKRLFRYHLRQLFASAGTPAMKADDALVRRARGKAADIPLQQRVVRRVEQSLAGSVLPDITLALAAGSDVTLTLRRKSQATVSDVAVSKFYTRASYRDLFLPQVQPMAESVIKEQAWVMGSSGSADNVRTLLSGQKLADEARKLYLLEYANGWNAFLTDIRARPVNGLEDAAQLARQLGDPSSSLANLVRFATRETSLTGKDSAGATSWFDRQRYRFEQQKREVVDELSGERSRFRLTPEDAVEDRFLTLRRTGLALSQANRGGGDPLSRLFDELFNQLSALATSLHSGQRLPQGGLERARLDAARQPEPIRSVVMDLIQQGSRESQRQNRLSIGKGASSLASGLCNSTVSRRYPFSRNARTEVGIDDFARLFGPAGAMKTFFDSQLVDLIDINADPWKARDGGAINAATVRAFENAAKIRETFFAGGERPAFTLFIRPVSLSPDIASATLDIDGQPIEYAIGESQPVRIDWPGPKGGSYIRLSFKTAQGDIHTALFEGPWALFHLYDASDVTPVDGNRRQLRMRMAGVSGSLLLELRSTMKDFPLWSRALGNFSCPQAL
ncbi:type VI secretion system membrane subunit TssM [Erwinia sp. Leaf53]|uniref:type VI secretion system membrane subunit TssM n=1 Tax=Erwinia sp. Leaf53 TaxID=1736225 RepID=UPI0006F489F4|nr:type VI secretion system membrane subunit TssM [Erwinia sp. Leaf53]KQN53241.1 hypothetical protein ASF13_16730 [Erwinia sp. Leaf53]